ncbi:hypothetical protein DVH24_010085 [Malus domestica]|uniref:TIR domain-containing protein n=1 Tax=Malus domestica TaxID=3750 RepID=A0A498JQP7_MALDO|nr:hypothetical protein DVH24_010085 [Malus domestica]
MDKGLLCCAHFSNAHRQPASSFRHLYSDLTPWSTRVMDLAASASAGGGGGPGGGADVHPSRKYDVFISFRGEDTRNTFTSHLHGALLQKKIETYIDYRLVRGSEIAPALLEAIEKSTLSLVIFSQNYASSTWCLDELAHILNCRETVDQMVIPIFYDISPSDVRKQQGTYADAFAQLEIRFKDSIDKVHKWRAALVTVANLSGFDYSNKTGIEYLYLDSTAIEELPSSVWSFEKIRCLELPNNIPILDLSGNATNCKILVSLLESICKLKSLKSLDLSGTTIRSLPASIGNLESLEKLDLSGTAIRSLPASIGNLESLEKLDLSGTAVKSLPTSIGNLESLEKLDLSGTTIKSLPASIGNLKSLVKLYLSGTAIEGLPASIGNLKSLKKLDLSETAIESLPASIGNLESLENLDLSGTAIKSLHASIGKLQYLQKFYLSGTAMESLPASIGNLKCLDKLDLSETAIKSLPASIGSLRSLEKLDLSGTAIESLPSSIGSLKSLENLDLSGTAIESLPASFDNLNSLVKLDLSGTAFKSLPASIGNLKSLEKLDLSGTAIESLPASIGNLKSLEKLDLSGTAVESLPASIGNLESLEKLDLSGTAIKSLPASIGNLECLEKLDLSGTAIESLPASIGNLESLKKLDLSGTAIESLPARIGNLKSLEKLDLSGTAIKTLPARIGNLKSLEKLDLSGTAIKCLPASIKEASRLISLWLTNCRSLESLPELPGVRWLEAHGCTSLNKVLSSRTALSLGWDEYKHSQGLQEQLTFSNCIGLGGDAWRDILTDSQIRIMRMATALSKYFTQEEIEVAFHLEFEEESNEYVFRSPVCIVCPGSTIPRWFPNEADNSALAINLGSNFFNTSFLGFAYSVVVAFENYNVGGSLSLGCKINFKGCGDPFIYHRSCMVAEYGEINDCKFDTPHVFVWFSSFDHVKQGSYNGVTEAIFDFYPIIEDRPDDGAVDCSNIKVTKCGIFPIPSTVQIQKGSYEVAFAQLGKRFKGTIDKVNAWRAALTTAANLSSFSNKTGLRLTPHASRLGRASPRTPCPRLTLLIHVHIHNLFLFSGSATLQAIFFNRSAIGGILLNHADFQKMYDLRLLYVYNSSRNKYCKVKVSLPHSLTYLDLEGYPFKSLPSKLCSEYLVELQMRNSQVEQLWNEGQNLRNLKVMDLGLCDHLIKVPDLSQSPNIEHIDLYGCLSDCTTLKYVPEMPSSIEYLHLDSTAIEELPSSVWSLEKIRCLELPKNILVLDLSGAATTCKNLVSLPETICKLKSLKRLDLSGTTIKNLPASIDLKSLEKLDLSGTTIKSLPASIGNLKSLKKLDLSGSAIEAYLQALISK